MPPFLVSFPVTPRRQPPRDSELSLRRVGGVALSLPGDLHGPPSTPAPTIPDVLTSTGNDRVRKVLFDLFKARRFHTLATV